MQRVQIAPLIKINQQKTIAPPIVATVSSSATSSSTVKIMLDKTKKTMDPMDEKENEEENEEEEYNDDVVNDMEATFMNAQITSL